MMSPKEIRDEMKIKIYSVIGPWGGIYEKLGIFDRFESVKNSNLYVLEDFLKKVYLVQELVRKYESDGNDLNNQIMFEKLKEDTGSIFKPKGFFSFFG